MKVVSIKVNSCIVQMFISFLVHELAFGYHTHHNSINLVPRSHSVTGNVRSGKVRQYSLFHWLLKKRLRQCNLRSDLLISWGTLVKVK